MMRKIFFMVLSLFILKASAQKPMLVVAQNGNSKFKTVQAALDAVPVNNKKPIIILSVRVFIRKSFFLIPLKIL